MDNEDLKFFLGLGGFILMLSLAMWILCDI